MANVTVAQGYLLSLLPPALLDQVAPCQRPTLPDNGQHWASSGSAQGQQWVSTRSAVGQQWASSGSAQGQQWVSTGPAQGHHRVTMCGHAHPSDHTSGEQVEHHPNARLIPLWKCFLAGDKKHQKKTVEKVCEANPGQRVAYTEDFTADDEYITLVCAMHRTMER